MHTFECDLPFCSNPECALHLGRGAADVRGRGNWARLDGRWVGRSTYCGVFLCDGVLSGMASRGRDFFGRRDPCLARRLDLGQCAEICGFATIDSDRVSAVATVGLSGH
jgi:hypothetical protein